MAVLIPLACALLTGALVLGALSARFPICRTTPARRPRAGASLWQTPALSWMGAAAEAIVPASRLDADRLRLRLDRAGIPLAPSAFYGTSVALVFCCAVLIVLGSSFALSGEPVARLVACACGIGLSACLPHAVLDRCTRARKKAIDAALPATLEMLAVTVEAGLTLERALRTVSRKRTDALARELARADDDISLFGYTREQALERMAQRCDSEDLSLFASSVAVSSKAGAPIAGILKRQAAAARTRRFQRLEAEANKIPTKMIFPLAFLVMPGVFIIAVTPAAISILNNVSEVF